MMREKDNLDPGEIISRRDYQEILLARMAGGDLYANEQRMKLRRADMLLDKLRIAAGEKPLYSAVRVEVKLFAFHEGAVPVPDGSLLP